MILSRVTPPDEGDFSESPTTVQSAGGGEQDDVSVGNGAMACLEWVCENQIWCLGCKVMEVGKERAQGNRGWYIQYARVWRIKGYSNAEEGKE